MSRPTATGGIATDERDSVDNCCGKPTIEVSGVRIPSTLRQCVVCNLVWQDNRNSIEKFRASLTIAAQDS